MVPRPVPCLGRYRHRSDVASVRRPTRLTDALVGQDRVPTRVSAPVPPPVIGRAISPAPATSTVGLRWVGRPDGYPQPSTRRQPVIHRPPTHLESRSARLCSCLLAEGTTARLRASHRSGARACSCLTAET